MELHTWVALRSTIATAPQQQRSQPCVNPTGLSGMGHGGFPNIPQALPTSELLAAVLDPRAGVAHFLLPEVKELPLADVFAHVVAWESRPPGTTFGVLGTHGCLLQVKQSQEDPTCVVDAEETWSAREGTLGEYSKVPMLWIRIALFSALPKGGRGELPSICPGPYQLPKAHIMLKNGRQTLGGVCAERRTQKCCGRHVAAGSGTGLELVLVRL